MPVFSKSSTIAASARRVFAWHQEPDALKKLIPPWEPVVVEKPPASLQDGETAVLLMRMGPLKFHWIARQSGFIDRGEAGGEFTDSQVSGPFASWVHRHAITAVSADEAKLEDRIEYRLPLGILGQTAAGWYVRAKLARMFEYRHQITKEAVEHDQPST